MAKIAEYRFNSDIDTLPDFEVGFTYTTTDTINNDGTTTRIIESDTLPNCIYFESKTGLIEVEYLETSNITDMDSMFSGCTNLVSLNGTGWNTSNVRSMYSTFHDCTSLVSLIGLSDWDTSSVIDFLWVFDSCSSLKEIEIHGWDLSNVTGEIFNCTFWNCSSLEKAIFPNWELPSAPYCFAMFGGCPNLKIIDFTGWNVDYLDDTTRMFTSSVLTCVILNDCNANTINEIIDALPSLSTNGVILTNTDTSSLNVSAANSKSYSFAKLKVATYKFNSNTDTLPTFNDGYTYTYTDVDNGDGTITRTIFSDSSPSSISFNGKNTMEEADAFCDALSDIAHINKKVRRI